MQILTPSSDPRLYQNSPFAGLDIALFFQKELRALVEQYGYTEAEYARFLSWHQPRDLVEKILDSNRFFRILRDDTGKIVGFFESRTGVEAEVVQWILINESAQWKWYGNHLWTEFLEYCRKKWTKKVISFTKENNIRSIQMHERLGFSGTAEDGEIIFTKIL